jgi:hypothetical protein
MQRIPRTHDISFFLDLYERGHLNLNPPYQRRSVWTRADREYFVDTILHNYPSPAIFLHKELDEDGKAIYHVVDGKQRLETIIAFTKNQVRIPRDFGDERLNGKKWDDLAPEDKRAVWDYSVSVEFLPVVDDAVVNSVFERINRNSRKLTAQELRHAKFDGWFAKFVEDQAADEDWEALGIVTKARVKRMADVQFLAELLIVVIKKDVVGFDQDTIDSCYAEYDDPDEALMVETTDEIEQRFTSAKRFMRDMLQGDGATRLYLKTLANSYSLWSWIALNPDKATDATSLAPKYVSFMTRVADFQKAPLLGIDSNPASRDFDASAARYAANLVGATTDAGPRRERLNALAQGLELAP